MDIITQNAYHRQRMIAYFEKHGATKASIRYRVSRKTVYKWVSRYDGSLESLKDKSKRPHTSPKSHTPLEIAMVKRALKKVKWQDLILAYQRLCQRGYTRSYGGFKRLVQRLRTSKPKSKPKQKPKPYQRADYPGQKMQIDVMYVPRECLVRGVMNKDGNIRGISGSQGFYQFTAIDECTRWTYRQMYEDKSSYSAKLFLDELLKAAPFPIRMIQTDNGSEFTNSLQVTKATHKTLFEQANKDAKARYKHLAKLVTLYED